MMFFRHKILDISQFRDIKYEVLHLRKYEMTITLENSVVEVKAGK
jgi:hypothetical protein